MKRRNYGTCMILVLLFFVGCSPEVSPNREMKEEMNDKINYKTETIQSVYENIVSDLEEATKNYTNMKIENIVPYCPAVDKIYELKDTPAKCYNGITDEKEMLDFQIGLAVQWLGEDLKRERFETGYCHMGNKEQYASFQEFWDALEEGEQLEPSWFCYPHSSLFLENGEPPVLDSPKDYRVFEVNKDLENIIYEKGEVSFNNMHAESNLIKSYYLRNKDCNLDDVYSLQDGEISIREAIDFVENYVNEEIPLEGKDADVNLKVETVNVYKNEYGYCLGFKIQKEILNVLWPQNGPGDFDTGYVARYDLSNVYMIRKNDIDIFDCDTRILSYEKVKEITEIIPLDTALEIVSTKIGGNSVYTIQKIELAYQQELRLLDPKQQADEIMPCWFIKGYNQQDNKETAFFVNAVTGGLKVSVEDYTMGS